MATEKDQTYWLSVIGRALASFSLQTEELRNKSLTEKARFLHGLSLDFEDIAGMLNSSEASVRELLRQSKKSKERKSRGGKKTKK